MTGIVESLQRSPLLADLPHEALARLAAQGTPVTVFAGEVLIAEGDEADAAYVVLDGELEVTKRVGEAELPLNRCHAGDPVGELGLLDERPRSATVRALRDSRLLRIEADAFQGLLAAPGIAQRLVSSTARRLEQREVVMRQHARMATLGSLTAGLLHELGNPAAALRRSSEQLAAAAADWESAADLLSPAELAAVRAAVVHAGAVAAADPLALGDVEDALRQRLAGTGSSAAGRLAARLAATGVTNGILDELAAVVPAARLELAARAVAARREVPAMAATAREAAARIDEVAQAVKTYTYHDQAPVQLVHVTDGLDQALTLLRHRVTPGVQVVRDYAPGLQPVEGYPGELNSVWTNRIDNAYDAVEDRGSVTLRVRAENNWVVVSVIDDGPGVPESIRDRLFDPFFTTKPVGKGAGLGLAIAHTVVTQRHGGQLDFTSRPGHTAFVVRLPCRVGRGS